MSNPKSTASIAGHPLHPMLVPFPIACFVGALACDIMFWDTQTAFWAAGAFWLLGTGVVMALVAALAGLTDFLAEPRIRTLNAAWLHMGGNVVLVLVEAYNFYLRYGMSGTPTTPPYGLALSAFGVVLLLFNGWQGWEMVYRHRVGVLDTAATGKDSRHGIHEEHYARPGAERVRPPPSRPGGGGWQEDSRLH
jgi:uncharacterized membrane protein